MKKILIIGALGMLGQELVKVFKGDKNYKVVAWDKQDIDITREVEVSKKISIIRPEIILNAAAYDAVDKCEEKKEYEIAKKMNGEALGFLAAAAKKNKAILVHYSTNHVFNGLPEIPEPTGCTHSCATCGLHADFTPEIGFSEVDKPKPINAYGRTKLLGEKAVAKNTKAYYLIRTAEIFGKFGLAMSAEKSFFEVMLALGKKNKEVRVVDEEMMSFAYASDVARKTKEIIDAQKPFGIYHLVNSGSATQYEACLELFRLMKIKTKVVPISREESPLGAKRPYCSVLLNTKLNPLRNYKDALEEYLKDLKQKS
ncbi:MAG: NAD(P)-dependent oxidoreductase [Parcubacteria group bacterium]